MVKRKDGSQIDSLTPDHKKLGINPMSFLAGGMQHVVGKLLTKATISLQTSSRSELCTRRYIATKLRKFQPWRFRDSHLGVSGQKVIWMRTPQKGVKYIIWGKVVASPEFGLWWVLWIESRLCFVLTPKVLQHCANQLVGWFCAGSYEWIVVYHSSYSHPGAPAHPSTSLKCWKPRSVPRTPNLSVVLYFRLILSLARSLGVCRLI
jgi:hypothetical protein